MTPRSVVPTTPSELWDRHEMATALPERDTGEVLATYRWWTGAPQTQLVRVIGVGEPTPQRPRAGRTPGGSSRAVRPLRERSGHSAPTSRTRRARPGRSRRTIPPGFDVA